MKWLLVILTLSMLLPILFLGEAQAQGEAVALPGYIRVRTSVPVAETFDRFIIYIESKVFNTTVNKTIPNPNVLTLRVYAEDLDVVVEQQQVVLIDGYREVYMVVTSDWTSASLNITVLDLTSGLTAYTRMETKMSVEYLLYLFFSDQAKINQQADARQEAAINQNNFMTLAFNVAMAATLFIVFIRTDHRRSRRVHAPSLWDRFANRVWPFSLVPDDGYVLLDETRTWARDVAVSYEGYRKDIHLRRLNDQLQDIKKEVVAIKEGKLDV